MNKKSLQTVSNALVLLTIFILLSTLDFTYLDWKAYATIAGSGIIVVILIVTTLRKK